MASKIVHAQPILITHLAPSSLVSKINEELSKYFSPEEEHLRSLIRLSVLTLVSSLLIKKDCRIVGLASDSSPYNLAPVDGSFERTYELLATNRPVPKLHEGEETYEAVDAPTLIIMDVRYLCSLINKTASGVVQRSLLGNHSTSSELSAATLSKSFLGLAVL